MAAWVTHRHFRGDIRLSCAEGGQTVCYGGQGGRVAAGITGNTCSALRSTGTSPPPVTCLCACNCSHFALYVTLPAHPTPRMLYPLTLQAPPPPPTFTRLDALLEALATRGVAPQPTRLMHATGARYA